MITRAINLSLAIMAIVQTSCGTGHQEDLKRSNVLMICIDDLRPELGCYGNPTIQTPNIDEFASDGVLFSNHYVQASLCGPSRLSLLTGKISQSSEIPIWKAYRDSTTAPEVPLALPQLFKDNGYTTIGVGKISHEPGGVKDDMQVVPQIPFSWDSTYTAVGKWKTRWRAFFAYANGDAHNKRRKIGLETPHPPYEMGAVDDQGYPDGLNAREAIKQLQRLKNDDKPFFLALGFVKPHLPFNAPKKYWDLYEKNKIPIADNNYIPKNLNNIYSVHRSPELTTHYPWPDGPGKVSLESAKTLKHGYYACVSYIDALVGKVLNELKRLDLEKNTIVVLWSDHGWQLGEHSMWGKMSNFEIATRSPLIIRIPDFKNKGVISKELVETVDIYPTLAELCGLRPPQDLDGKNIVTSITNEKVKGKSFARSFYYRNGALGKTIRTDRYRVVQWTNEKDSIMAVELYDHLKDPKENLNIAFQNKALTDSLLTQLNGLKFLDDNAPFLRWE